MIPVTEAVALHVGAIVVPHHSHLQLCGQLVMALRDDAVEGPWLAEELERAAIKAGHDRVALAASGVRFGGHSAMQSIIISHVAISAN